MSQVSNDGSYGAGAQPSDETAQVIPFERPQTDLQRALQQRAQELMDRDRERRKTKPAPLKWAIMAALALVPVVFLLTAVDAFVRVFHHINAMYADLPEPEPAPEPAPAGPAPVWISDEPGVVALQSLFPTEEAAAPAAETQPAESAPSAPPADSNSTPKTP